MWRPAYIDEDDHRFIGCQFVGGGRIDCRKCELLFDPEDDLNKADIANGGKGEVVCCFLINCAMEPREREIILKWIKSRGKSRRWNKKIYVEV